MKTNIKWWTIGIGLVLVIIVGFVMLKSPTVMNLQTYQYNMELKEIRHSSVSILSRSDVISTDPIVDPRQEYTYEQMVEDIEELSERYHGLVTSKVIGESVDGREIHAVRLGYGEREVFINAATHAREWMTTNLVMNQLDLYSQTFVNDDKVDGYDARDLLQQVSIYYVPMVNPDGVKLVQKGADALGNSEFLLDIHDNNPDFARWKTNANGVDLNRNFPVGWDEAHADTGEPSFQNFKGEYPMSEPETQAIAEFIQGHNFELVVAYHSSGELIYWGENLPDDLEDEIYEFALLFSEKTGYPMHRGAYGGMFSDWVVNEVGVPSLTPEIAPYAGPGPVPLEHFDLIWEQHYSTGLMMADYILVNKK